MNQDVSEWASFNRQRLQDCANSLSGKDELKDKVKGKNQSQICHAWNFQTRLFFARLSPQKVKGEADCDASLQRKWRT